MVNIIIKYILLWIISITINIMNYIKLVNYIIIS